ncbi:bifunctional D-glycero-beta-D-manno-heptose-7-phosphate kinase/D-glycero-beta-D-manno-heptose 1-phosphate adenylyltransferase HldE [Paraneptunicella aestuarii]|uniref:bifunctional D-glycero-beta-D-manno-heptose-7-phosphate kinase/D-glycero-beta-D-manno-heptose 1-phosphate adenylyltransferase HldE n=1 Tax=Paraneptunicella aestuarii TaxID=2831148 RepID=UPI001E35E9AC|nr:bifunctional D-glycero-beta-D-manno-heptose-7-phosphate kinase/D-glycero-beta-D-manno-heptose 1-phosphate adenylyltransferase HldE [Paraneptunicella aestuarii]UAA37662.1 bifunctional D-glycero-beta-D-manno-heptose-7-phosphate kinase/D-glycero-beta-D-manno-heptose 1-phosphate adenylyltransferase HldE [Paraneptunicella aestuarii]
MQIPVFSKANVVVVGDIMLDRYWLGPTSRISPEAPVPVVKIEGSEERPGGAANVALNIAALGAKVAVGGLCGKDEAAQTLQQVLGSVGIECFFDQVEGQETITKLRILSRNQQLIRLDFEQNFQHISKQPLLALAQQQLASAGALVLSDYAKGCLSEPQTFIQLAKEKNIPVVVDPKGTDFARYRGATLLTPNMSEFQGVVGVCLDEDSIVAKAQKLIQDLDLQALLVTRSEHGMTLIQRDQPELHLPAKAKEVYDVTGAGDTVVAALAASLASGASLPDACVLANAAAGVVVGKLGTSTVNVNELAHAVSMDTDIGLGVMTEEQLKIAVRTAKLRGERIVMTNGCFDILHSGHVSYLENAAKLGNRLIVAVNSDESVKKLKGAGRPINNLERRMSVLSALASVDWVVPFGEETPERLISEILPDLLVKGGDYKPEDIAGGKQVVANGGEVKVLNFEDGISTTNIIKEIVKQN